MRVRCVSEYPSEEQIRQFGQSYRSQDYFGLTLGQEYVVFGLSFLIDSTSGTTTFVGYYDGQNLLFAPLVLFEIVNPRTSRYWEARMHEDGSVTLWPPQFYADCFHDRLSDGEQEAIESFEEAYRILENEDIEAIYRADPCRDLLNETLADIQTAILANRPESMAKHVQPDGTVSILNEGIVDYALTGSEYIDMVSDIVQPSEVMRFDWRKSRWNADGSVTWFVMLSHSGGRKVYQSYTLRHTESDYVITAVGVSTKPTW